MSQHPRGAEQRATVLIPVLNNQAFLPALLHSLLTQWRPGLELLVVDDGSSDGSFETARKVLAGYPGISARLLRNPSPQGVAQLPAVLRQVGAPVVIQADSDDVALPGRLDAILNCFEADPACRLVTTNAVLLSETGLPIGLLDSEQGDEVIRDPARVAGQVGSRQWFGSTCAYHRSLLEDFPAIDPGLCPYGVDLLLPFRAVLTGTHHYLAEPSIGWRQHGRNTHKLAGGANRADEAVERHGAFELMALAQRFRDLADIREKHPDPAALDAVAAACQQSFLDHFTHWSRVRNRLTLQTGPGAALKPVTTVAAIPPMMVLGRAERVSFGVDGTLGTLARDWPGFFPPEGQLNWMARTALVTFGLAGGRPDAVVLGVRCTGFSETRRLRVSVNLGPMHEFEVTEAECTITVPMGPSTLHDTLTILFHVPSAIRPLDIGLNDDVRLLGMQLLFVETRQ